MSYSFHSSKSSLSIPSLLNRSYYSFLNSSLTIQDIVSWAVSNKHTHVVISDFESSYSWFKFYKEATENNIIPVFGIQVNYKNSSLLFLAKNKEGYRELLKLSNHKNVELISFENLVFIHLEGEDHFPYTFKYLANVDRENGVYIKENKFLKDSDYEFFCLLRAINNNRTIEEELGLNQQYIDDYLEKDVDSSLLETKQVENIYEILKQCTFYEIIEKQNTLAFFKEPEKVLKNTIEKIFESFKFKDSIEKERYRTRLEQEIEVLVNKGFCEYFLIVYDAVNWAKENKIYIGPGRGSVCGSLVAYILGITEIDPLKYELYFERFLNVTRSTIPDIDIDVANNKRETLFQYLQSKYGTDNVALISVFRTFKVKNSIREVCKAYGVPIQLVEKALKDLKSDDELNFSTEGLTELSSSYSHLISPLIKIQNYPCNPSVHAAGVLISSVPFSSIIPLTTASHSPLLSSQWEADEIKELGLIKFDFLALQYLQCLSNIEQRIEKELGNPIVWDKVNLNDPKVYETIVKGRNICIFQFESIAIKKLIQNFKPTSLLDLALLSSIHRPGASDQIPILLARKSSSKKGKESRYEGFVETNKKSNSPLLEILKDTYGLLIYQEQLMKIVSTVTHCSFGEADNFRRAISSSPEKLPLAKKWFFQEGKEFYEQEELNPLWDSISKFAKYGFNKSHAVAYALISYRLIWLKTYYPEYFYSEFLSMSLNTDCFYELEEIGYVISPPTYSKSDFSYFKAIKNIFYFPVSQIIGLNITKEQYSLIPFKASTAVFAIEELIQCSIPIEMIRLLIRVGYFNSLFTKEESELFLEINLETIRDNTIYKAKGQSIFSLETKPVHCTPEDIQRYKRYQKELLGVNLDRLRIPQKVFEKYPSLKRINTLTSQNNSTHKYIGFIIYTKESKTFRDIPFLWLKISDGFYVTPNIAFFDKPEEFEKWKTTSINKSPVILDIEKEDEYYKALRIRVIN